MRYLHTFLTSPLDGGQWPPSRAGRLNPRRDPGYPLDRRLDGSQSRSGRGGEEKNSQPLPANPENEATSIKVNSSTNSCEDN